MMLNISPKLKNRMPNSQSEEISKLLIAVKYGSHDSFKLLYNKMSKRIFSYLFKLCFNKDLAEEATQDVFVKLWRKRGSYQERSRAESYIFTVARNMFIDKIRTTRDTKLLNTPLFNSNTSDPLAQTIFSELQLALNDSLRKLEPELREVYHLIRNEAMSYAEIASILGVSEKTVEARMHRALEQLRENIKPWLDTSFSK